MKVRIPVAPLRAPSRPSSLPPTKAFAIERIASLLRDGNVLALTGAGVSVDSGIRAYRGNDGRYMNPNYHPIFYHELVDSTPVGHKFRQRYWARSYFGYPPVRDAQPNPTHYAIAALQHANLVSRLITQNVDGLHPKALSGVPGWTQERVQSRILELHGMLRMVHCKNGHVMSREEFQTSLAELNPTLRAISDEFEQSGAMPRRNPDGDVELEGVNYADVVVPECKDCAKEKGIHNSILKPNVVFFGETIDQHLKDRAMNQVYNCRSVLVIGTTLATYSAYSLVKRAHELNKPIMVLNVGPTRADELSGVEKFEWTSGEVLQEVCKTILGSDAGDDIVIRKLLDSGVIKAISDES
ncbi:hypothetical protein BOTBODRAFT_28251 [Botryobasidium botryosum FD-172 SS1]|uniref:Deacetylase sirtuin-type domain-containing protein n=1 Tax=Botryobasidium botryosum (strain FD-172 SS1) TaxID=930990 RepID=A0A067N6C6_BOTB1|nr:hypothetical protein BOTBODRAFT_28251 [Botryobasidium botryosum FD-172 SS1]